ncbi:MAG: class II fumarate hydratase [Mycoplasmataceae bacterium]|nr:class II fumarate hydratase [Mycoplasmataceae bacterium]
MSKRIEKDSLGEIAVENSKYWGAQTQRSLENFVIGHETMPHSLIKAIVAIKMAAAQANLSFKKLDGNKTNAIVKVCDLIMSNKLNNEFPLKIWQTGSGTQTNMNVNEVVANYANMKILKAKMINPNDHVNMSQSSNDVFPTAIHVAMAAKINESLLPNAQKLINALKVLETKYSKVIKIGRTHLQDATPITLGQEISGWRTSLESCLSLVKDSLKYLYELPLGGTAVGTGLNTPKNFDKKAISNLASIYDIPFKPMNNKFDGLAFKERIAASHSMLKVLATSLYKVANDVRFLASGPRAGIGELNIPANEPGSSIMPGKVNPTQCEAMMMVCLQVIGNDTTISVAASQGNFELNTFMPLIAYDALQSIRLLSDAMDSFTKKCVVDITANREKIQHNLDNSLMLVTALSPKIGYAKAAEIAKYAHKNGTTLKQAALKLKYVSESEFNKLVDPKKMI